ncbi:MAG: NUDIX hydrolase [Spirochaetia bacterium]
MKDHLLWKHVSHRTVYKTRVFNLQEAKRKNAEGREAEFYIIDSPNWVNVVPVLQNDEETDCFLMVGQYRQGSERFTMEFPGGVIDEGETPEEAARRELLEETGYTPGRIELAGEISPNPAIMNNRVFTYVAIDLQLTHKQNLDLDEFLDFELIPVQEVEEKMGTAEYDHAIMMVALGYYNKWKQRHI